MITVKKLYWWAGTVNFGDMIGPDLVECLLGKRLELARGGDTGVLLGPGSIIDYCDRFASSVVWGSGIDPHYGKLPRKPENITYLAVRGPETRKTLGINVDVIGDPGLLLPSIYPKAPEGGPISVVLHHSTMARRLRDTILFDPFKSGFRVIDPRREWRKVVDDICASEFVFCQSLHGAIVAEAYGVPWAWWKGFHGWMADFKWKDWFGSISTPPKSFSLRDVRGAMKWRANTKTKLPDLTALRQVLVEGTRAG